MPKITIDFDSEENKNIGIFKAEQNLRNKADAVKLIVKKYFKIKKR